MSDKAIETESSFTIEEDSEIEAAETTEVVEAADTDESEVIEVEASAQADEEADELDIVVDGEEQPSSKPARKSRFRRRIESKNHQIAEANSELEAARLEAESLREQNKLLRMKEAAEPAPTRPKVEDFDDDDAYGEALDKYITHQSREAAGSMLRERIEKASTETSEREAEAKQNAIEDNHYERVESLGVSPTGYQAAEARAAAILGEDALKAIMRNKLSHILLYHLGLPKYEAKAEYFSSLLKREPVDGLMEIGGYANKLVIKPKHSTTPDPESRIDPGSAAAGDRVAGVTYE